ncbi:MAG TPA: toxic anion resistance protein, partial [Chloroflexota bacterium]|nr:toxic anion resistance protein [Chloroflexota bacterium]
MTTTPTTANSENELILEPPQPIHPQAVTDAASRIRIDDQTAAQISHVVDEFVDSLVGLEAQSPELERKIRSISHMGSEEIRRAAGASSRFLDRPTAAL